MNNRAIRNEEKASLARKTERNQAMLVRETEKNQAIERDRINRDIEESEYKGEVAEEKSSSLNRNPRGKKIDLTNEESLSGPNPINKLASEPTQIISQLTGNLESSQKTSKQQVRGDNRAELAQFEGNNYLEAIDNKSQYEGNSYIGVSPSKTDNLIPELSKVTKADKINAPSSTPKDKSAAAKTITKK